jgi:two-component system, cell cycle sensor histidine kinase and response regulator CckA
MDSAPPAVPATGAIPVHVGELDAYFTTPALGVVIVDTDDRCVKVSDHFCRMLGRSRDDLIGRSFLDWTHPDDRETHLPAISALAREDLPSASFEKRYVRKDGSTLWALVSVSFARAADGRILNRIAIIQDIGERVAARKQLEESERRFRLLFENLREEASIYRVIRDGSGLAVDWELLEVNTAARENRQAETPFVPGWRLVETFGRAAVQEIIDTTNEILAGGRSTSVQEFRPTGRWYSWSAFPLDQDTLVTVSVDVTTRMALERDLTRANEIAKLGNWTWDVRTDRLEASGQLCAMLGIRKDEAPRTRAEMFARFLHPDDLAAVTDRALHVQAGALPQMDEFRYVLPDGSTKYGWTIIGDVRCGADGRPVTVSGVTQDVTAFRLAEIAKDRFEARFRAVVEHSNQGVFFLTPQRRETYRSPAAERLGGYRDAERLGRDLIEAVHADDVVVFTAAWDQAVARPAEPITFECRGLRGDGEWRLTAATLTNLVNHPAIGEFVLTIEDITDRRRAEQRLRDAHKLEAVGLLAGGVAHQFNNILAAMTLNLEVVRANPLSLPFRQELGSMAGLAERAATIVGQLLASSQRLMVRLRPVDWATRVESQLARLARKAGSHISLRFSVRGEIPMVQADPSLLDQVLEQLCTNAAEAMPDGGTIEVSMDTRELGVDDLGGVSDHEPGRYVRLSVRDHGAGMSPEVKARLFEPFFTTKGTAAGRGLGLATVQGMILQQRGGITIESTPGEGTTCNVCLPVAETATA